MKPDNILLGLHPYSDTLHIIDFGLAKQYRDPRTHIHTKYQTGLSPIGTARYSSINAQSGFELSRRDDIESLTYILIYFLRGSLPWQNIPGSMKTKQTLMLQMKKTIKPHVLCEGLPVEFELFLKHARKLKFEQRPNYRYLHGLVQKLLSKQEASTMDWEVAKGLAGNWPSKGEALVKMQMYVCFRLLFFCNILLFPGQNAKTPSPLNKVIYVLLVSR